MPEDPKRFIRDQQATPKPRPRTNDAVPPAEPQPSPRQDEPGRGDANDSRDDARGGAGDTDVSARDVDRLGSYLARALQEGDYHPVILFGTSFSGKTSLLLSLLSTLTSEPRFKAGIVLCDPILGSESHIGRSLHDDARQLFEVKTQAFIEGEPVEATRLPLPFFVPVEVRPEGKRPVRFAFLESNGEWYRPVRDKSKPLATAERLYPQFRTEIEDFIANFQGGISFLYLIPFSQARQATDRDTPVDADELQSASLAIAGVLRAYDRIRATQRVNDRHLMLVTKWDVRSIRDIDRPEGVAEDRDALNEFCRGRYGQALAAFQALELAPHQRGLHSYSSGIMNERGLLQLRHDDDLRDAIMNYPVRLWTWLYKNALASGDHPVESPFPEPPKQPTLVRLWNRLLDFISGR